MIFKSSCGGDTLTFDVSEGQQNREVKQKRFSWFTRDSKDPGSSKCSSNTREAASKNYATGLKIGEIQLAEDFVGRAEDCSKE